MVSEIFLKFMQTILSWRERSSLMVVFFVDGNTLIKSIDFSNILLDLDTTIFHAGAFF